MASVSDNFDRSDGELGANWTVDTGDIHVVSQVAESQTASAWNRARYATALDSKDHWVQAVIGGKSDSNCGNVVARQASSAHTCYSGDYVEYSVSNGYRLKKLVSGSETDLDTAASGSGSKTFKLTVNGASQTLEVDSTEVCSASDSAITLGNYVGLTCWSNNGSRWNNFSAQDIVTGSTYNEYATHSAAAALSAAGDISLVKTYNESILCKAFAACNPSGTGRYVRTFTSSGSATWTCPDGITSIQVECWGGGGGGGNRTTTGASGGGGGGAYAKLNSLAVTPGTGYSYSVGAAGSTVGGNGGDTTFNTTSCVARGGSGPGANNATGAAGGSGSTSTGNSTYTGGSGANGSTGSYGGGGGGSGGTGSVGNSASTQLGATAVTGGGPGGNGRASSNGNGSAPSSGPGGGGGGGLRTSSGTRYGGAGYAGQITITGDFVISKIWDTFLLLSASADESGVGELGTPTYYEYATHSAVAQLTGANVGNLRNALTITANVTQPVASLQQMTSSMTLSATAGASIIGGLVFNVSTTIGASVGLSDTGIRASVGSVSITAAPAIALAAIGSWLNSASFAASLQSAPGSIQSMLGSASLGANVGVSAASVAIVLGQLTLQAAASLSAAGDVTVGGGTYNEYATISANAAHNLGSLITMIASSSHGLNAAMVAQSLMMLGQSVAVSAVASSASTATLNTIQALTLTANITFVPAPQHTGRSSATHSANATFVPTPQHTGRSSTTLSANAALSAVGRTILVPSVTYSVTAGFSTVSALGNEYFEYLVITAAAQMASAGGLVLVDGITLRVGAAAPDIIQLDNGVLGKKAASPFYVKI